MKPSTALVCAFSVCLPLCSALAVAPPAPSVAALVKQLGSDSFAQRERAARQLQELETVPAELRLALKSSDPEVRRTSVRIVAEIEGAPARRALREAAELAKAGEIDQVIERAVRYAEKDVTGGALVELDGMVKRLAQAEARRFGTLRQPWGNRLMLLAEAQRRLPDPSDSVAVWASSRPLVYDERKVKRVVLCGAGVTCKAGLGLRGVIVSSGDVKLHGKGRYANGAIFACGSVLLEDSGDYLLIISDGDVRVQGKVLRDSLIVARGDVTLPFYLARVVVLAGGSVSYTKRGPDLRGCVVREKDSSGLGVVKFFDPARVGVEVAAGKDGVTVKKADKDKPFAAVLRPGDVVTAVGSAKVCSVAAFRARLRAALAEGTKSLTLSVRRDGKELEVRVVVRR